MTSWNSVLAALLFAALVVAAAIALVVVENQRDRPPLVESAGTEAARATGTGAPR